SFLPNPSNPTGASLAVETIRLDEVPDMERVDFLKIDVEGAEAAVLRSLGDIRPPHVLLEYNWERVRAGGGSGPGFLRLLRELGYRTITNIDDPEAGLRPVEADAEESMNLYARL